MTERTSPSLLGYFEVICICPDPPKESRFQLKANTLCKVVSRRVYRHGLKKMFQVNLAPRSILWNRSGDGRTLVRNASQEATAAATSRRRLKNGIGC